jgi:hypothetical protein
MTTLCYTTKYVKAADLKIIYATASIHAVAACPKRGNINNLPERDRSNTLGLDQAVS